MDFPYLPLPRRTSLISLSLDGSSSFSLSLDGSSSFSLSLDGRGQG